MVENANYGHSTVPSHMSPGASEALIEVIENANYEGFETSGPVCVKPKADRERPDSELMIVENTTYVSTMQENVDFPDITSNPEHPPEIFEPGLEVECNNESVKSISDDSFNYSLVGPVE